MLYLESRDAIPKGLFLLRCLGCLVVSRMEVICIYHIQVYMGISLGVARNDQVEVSTPWVSGAIRR
jgi:hypothetical protein